MGIYWSETIAKFLGKTYPNPKGLMFNAGTLRPHDFGDTEVREMVVVIRVIRDNWMVSV